MPFISNKLIVGPLFAYFPAFHNNYVVSFAQNVNVVSNENARLVLKDRTRRMSQFRSSFVYLPNTVSLLPRIDYSKIYLEYPGVRVYNMSKNVLSNMSIYS